jgi:hypothetical protein
MQKKFVREQALEIMSYNERNDLHQSSIKGKKLSILKKFMQNFDLQGDEKAAHRLLGKKMSYLALYD